VPVCPERAATKIVGLYHEQANIQMEAKNGKNFGFFGGAWRSKGIKGLLGRESFFSIMGRKGEKGKGEKCAADKLVRK
jgi:hypothetical protein